MLNRQPPNKAPVKAFVPSQYHKPDASTLKQQLTREQYHVTQNTRQTIVTLLKHLTLLFHRKFRVISGIG
ncbi:hypothetical protein [Thiopseudomonas acetoxidans]|uniref:hypothetical protein n=1 Tax=Thiopseudomonas acetoxidans TaxID=3041622 RepID=UPI0025A22637|nr:hypothetical protein [Thiopseudomonas sp. CY1220]